jgi:hypothetical protein
VADTGTRVVAAPDGSTRIAHLPPSGARWPPRRPSRDPYRRRHRAGRSRVAAWLAALAFAGCGRAPHSDGDNVIVRPQPPPEAARRPGADGFAGVGQLSPLADGFLVTWDAVVDDAGVASGDFAYRVYVAFNGAPFDFATPFVVTAPGASELALTGVAAATRLSVVVQAQSLVDPADVDSNEIALDGVVAALWYVDDDAAPGGDGRTALTPLREIADAVLAVALSRAQGDVLIAGGSYSEVLLLPGGIHLYGSYDAAFASRGKEQHRSVLRPPLATPIAVAVVNAGAPTFVDGLDVEGDASVGIALSADESDLQWSNGTIHETVNEGIHAISASRASLLRLREVEVVGCADEGLFAKGSFVAELTGCTFRENGDEGIHFDDLSVQPAGSAELWIRDCLFEHNDNDGLEVEIDELDPATGGTSAGGRIEVLVERSTATANRRRGLLVDFDFENADQIACAVVLREDEVDRQVEDGIRVDADAAGLVVLDRNRTSANGECGVQLTGGSTRATIVVANHWELGAAGDGICVLNHVPTILAHAAVTGSGGAGVTGNGSTLLVDGALWLCGAPVAVDATYTYADFPLPGAGNIDGAPQVSVAPVQAFHLTVKGPDRDRFLVPAGETLAPGDWIEVDDDQIARQVVATAGDRVFFSAARNRPPSEGAFVARFSAPDVFEDPRLVDGATWLDAGDPIDLDGDGSVADVGVLGGTLETFVPRRSTGWIPFVVQQMTPPPGTLAAPVAEIRARFTRPVDPASVDATTFVVLLNDVPAAGTLSVEVDTIVFVPTVPLAGGTVEVEVHRAIAATTGEVVELPYRYWLRVP